MGETCAVDMLQSRKLGQMRVALAPNDENLEVMVLSLGAQEKRLKVNVAAHWGKLEVLL